MEAFDFVAYGGMYEHEAYICRQSGKVYWNSEFGDNFEELPDDITDDSKYVGIPHKTELDLGSELALKFVAQFCPQHLDQVDKIFHRKGAYANFKALMELNGLIDQWYEFENRASEEALREWCRDNDIEIEEMPATA